MPDGDTYELSQEAIYEGQSVVNVFHYLQVGADGTGDPRLGLVNAWLDELFGLIIPNLVPEYAMLQFRTRGILLNETQTLLTLNVTNGGNLGDGLPPNSVAMTRNYGERAGRKGTGRTLWTGVPELQTDQGLCELAYLAGWVAYENAAVLPLTRLPLILSNSACFLTWMT